MTIDEFMAALGVEETLRVRWARWRYRRTHRPFDWQLDAPEYALASETHVRRRVWPDPEPRLPVIEPDFDKEHERG